MTLWSQQLAWRRHGLIFHPETTIAWQKSHAQLPVSWALDNGMHRVFFASRDEKQRSHVACVDIDLIDPSRMERHDSYCLAPGPLGEFDDHGVYPRSLIETEEGLLMYYIGWNPGPYSPLFYATIGLAISDDGGLSFRRTQRTPILGRSEIDPCLVTSPCVLRRNGEWLMWYTSGYLWREDQGVLHAEYDIKLARSSDGRSWERSPTPCIPVDHANDEWATAAPCVLEDADGFVMFYSYHRGTGYRIGHATSPDGVTWARRDDLTGLQPSESGWDAGAVAYPWAVKRDGALHLLYNGGSFGRDGFGLAELLS